MATLTPLLLDDGHFAEVNLINWSINFSDGFRPSQKCIVAHTSPASNCKTKQSNMPTCAKKGTLYNRRIIYFNKDRALCHSI
jgi:hypothetical protein